MSLRKKTVVAAALESTLGVAASLTAANAQFVVYDLQATLNAEEEMRDTPGSLSKLDSIIGPRSYDITFKQEISGSGAVDTNPDWAEVFLPAVGMADTANVFALLSGMPVASAGSPRTITIGGYTDGRRFMASGCMGSAKFTFTNGKRGFIEYTMKGKYEDVTDQTLLAPTLPAIIPPRSANMTFTLGGSNPGIAPEVTIDLQNEVTLGEDLTSTGADAGYTYARIVDRNPIVTASLEQPKVAVNDLHGKMMAGTTEAMILKIGGATWNALQIDAPRAQVVNIAYGEREGIHTDDITWGLKRDSANEDEITISFLAS